MILITSSYFCAGAIIENGIIVKAAPIIGWMHGKTLEEIQTYCARRRWKVETITI